MKFYIYASILLFICSLGTLYLYFSEKRINSYYEEYLEEIQEKSESDATDMNTLVGILIDQWNLEDTTLNPDDMLFDQSNQIVTMKELAEKKKLIFRFKEANCNACVFQELKLIDEIFTDKDQIGIIAQFDNIRAMKIFMKSNNILIDFYWFSNEEENSFPDILETGNAPYAFMLDSQLLMSRIHIANSNMEAVSRGYYESIKLH